MKVVPRILYSEYNQAIEDALREMAKYIGPTHKSILAVQALKKA